MPSKDKIVMNWSGGKDAALALYRILQEGRFKVVSLLTTVDPGDGRSSMHRIPSSLLRAQAAAIGLPIEIIAPQYGRDGYESGMESVVRRYAEMGVKHFAFGDICLADIRRYRKGMLRPYGIEVVEPLWEDDTGKVMERFLNSGLQTVVLTTMADKMDSGFIGRTVDREFVASLPAGVDPCGENGEYHTFCYGGPIFRSAVEFTLGKPYLEKHTVKMADGRQTENAYWYANITEKE